MVGREAEFTTMRRGLASAAGGECNCRIVAGGHGVGKTRLLQETADHAASQGFVTVRAVAYQNDANVPYSVVSDALGPLVRRMDPNGLKTLVRGADAELAHIIPAFASGDRTTRIDDSGDLTPRVRWHAAQFLTRLSARAPVLFTVDNAQWADPSSVSLLHFVLRHAPDARLMVAAAFNHLEADAASPIRSMVKAIAGMPGSGQLMLAPLTEADIVELLVRSFVVEPAQVRAFATFLHGHTLGNPFFVEEMIKMLIQRGTLRRDGDRWLGWDVEDIDVPATIREVLLERVNALSPGARRIADLASVVGSRVSHDLLRRASDLDDAALLAATESLHRAAIMGEVEEGEDILYDFTHPLLQRTLYEVVGAARRRELHALVARTLEERFGAHAERHATELAYHFVRANAPALAPKSFRYLRLAGSDAVAKHADREAARYLQHGLDLVDRGLPADDDTAFIPEVVEQLARVRQRLGEYDASRALWWRAKQLCEASGDEAGLARIERRIGQLSFWSGQPHLSLVHYDNALAHARTAKLPAVEARTLMAKGMALMAAGQPEDAKAAMHGALELVEDLGDVGLRARVEYALALVYGYAGPADVATGFARRVLEDAEAAGEMGLAWAAHHVTAALACFTANATVVAHHVAEAERIAKALHSPMLSAQNAEPAIEYASAKGDWAEGLMLAERAIPVARAMSPRSLLPRLLVWMGSILLNRDELERAKACFDEAWELSRARSSDTAGADLSAVIVAHIGQAAYHLTTRDWLTAIEFAQRGIEIADRHGMTSWTLHRLLPMLAEAALWVGDFALAEKSAARLRADSKRFNHGLGEAWAFTVDQLISRWRDNVPGVVDRLLGAAEALEAVPFVFHAARLRRHVARLLVIDGDREGAARELRRIHDVYLRLGAALELRLTREMMRELGIRPPQQTVVQGGTLTHREREIAQLVARHKTNKEIARALDISARTVSTHLSNVFQKLGVGSRSALAERVRELGD
jgi:DNA-binding CsgD family transcriptional regulator